MGRQVYLNVQKQLINCPVFVGNIESIAIKLGLYSLSALVDLSA